jgi:hypothetical protein
VSDSLDKANETFVRNLEAKTGKTVAEWIGVARGLGAKHGEIVKALKSEHGLTHGYANYIALETLKSAEPGADDPLAAQYAGDRARLRPIYDKLVKALNKLGPDVALAPKKAYVSVRRKKQFACIQPSTATRVDVGVNLKGAKPAGRLEASGSFNTMFTHRVRVETPGEVDAELLAWLKQAYDEAG